MSSATPRLLSARSLGFAAVTSVMAVAALALSSGEALVDRSFETAFATAGRTVETSRSGPRETTPATSGQDLWLTRHDGRQTFPHQASSRIGERITMSVDGGPPVELEVVAVTDIATPIAAASDVTAGSRLVMMTCREVGRETGGRVVRMILDGDEPLPGMAANGPSRAL